MIEPENCCNQVADVTPYRPPALDIHTLVDRNAAMAEVRYYTTDRMFIATGSSKRDKGDLFSPEVGRQIATARALQSLARYIEKDATARAPWAV